MAEEAQLQALLSKDTLPTDRHLGALDDILGDDTPVCERAAMLTEQLRQLKAELKALQSKRWFLEELQRGGSGHDADHELVSMFPSSAEAADLELLLAGEKAKLRAAKKCRATQEARLRHTTAEYAAARAELDDAQSQSAHLVRAARAMRQMHIADIALREDDRDKLDTLATDSHLCTGAARRLVNALSSDAYEARSRTDADSASHARMRGQLAALAERRERLQQSLKDLGSRQDEKERGDQRAQALKRDLDMLTQRLHKQQRVSGCPVFNVDSNKLTCSIQPAAFDAWASSNLNSDSQSLLTIALKNGIGSPVVSASLSAIDSSTQEQDIVLPYNTVEVPIVLNTAISAVISNLKV